MTFQPAPPSSGAAALAGAVRTLAAGSLLDPGAAQAAFRVLLTDQADEVQVAGFLSALAVAGTNAATLAAAVSAIRAVGHQVSWSGPCLDVVGTGGDGSDSANISTIAGLIAAAAGATVAKSGNRASTSACGSADLLEQLDIPTGDLASVPPNLSSHGFAFVHTASAHPRVARLSSLRRRLGVRTVLNLAGPLCSPVALTGRIVGTASRADQDAIAGACAMVTTIPTWVILGHDGLDELTTSGPSRVLSVERGIVTERFLHPAGLGLAPAGRDQLRGAHPATNALLARQVLTGRGGPALRDTCLLNAAALLVVGGHAASIEDGLERAAQAVLDGRTATLLDRLATGTRHLHPGAIPLTTRTTNPTIGPTISQGEQKRAS